ncbi:MAG: phosphoribosyltransferase family protein [Myxococcota bacterium]
MRDLFAGLLDLWLPPACAACGEPTEHALCARCTAALPRIPAGRCALCQERPAAPGRGDRCAACARRRGPLLACVAGCWYEGDAAAWIRAYKYARRRGLSADDRLRVCALAGETLARAPAEPPDQVVPVPLHRRRLRARGFNPALAVARHLARARGVPLRPRALARCRDTPSQTGLSRSGRRRNVRGAFRAPAPVPARVWLVDDVVTTGATLAEAARVLRRAGAKQVVALCAARTPAPGPSPRGRSSPR